MRFKNVSRVVAFVLCIIPAFSVAMAGTAERKNIAMALTREYIQKGLDQTTFEATGKDYRTIRIVQKNAPSLTKGQLLSILGSNLTPQTVSRLKKAGFKRGVLIDGRSNSYPFDISRRYYDKLMKNLGVQ